MKEFWGNINILGDLQIDSTSLFDTSGKFKSSFMPAQEVWTTSTFSGTSFSFASITDNYVVYQCGELASIMTAARSGLIEVMVAFVTGETPTTIAELTPFYFAGDDCSGGMFYAKPYRKYIFRVRTINDVASAEVRGFPRGDILKYAGGSVSRTLSNNKCYIFKTPITNLNIILTPVSTYGQLVFQASPTSDMTLALGGQQIFSGANCVNGVFNPVRGSTYLLTYIANGNQCKMDIL